MTSMSTPTSARSNKKVKAKEEKERMVSRIGDNHAMITGDQKAFNMDTTARSIIPEDNQGDVRYVALLKITHHSVLDL